jgi:rhodanese-related sulfurtransferase
MATTFRWILLFGLFVPLMSSCQVKTSQKEVPVQTTEVKSIYEKCDPVQFKTRLDANPTAQLIDVRTPQEYTNGTIGKAVNMDIMTGEFEAKVITLDRTKPVYVFCQGGVRSSKAATRMQELGFREIYELKDGYASWGF